VGKAGSAGQEYFLEVLSGTESGGEGIRSSSFGDAYRASTHTSGFILQEQWTGGVQVQWFSSKESWWASHGK